MNDTQIDLTLAQTPSPDPETQEPGQEPQPPQPQQPQEPGTEEPSPGQEPAKKPKAKRPRLTPFLKKIKSHLDALAATDKAFAGKYADPDKSLARCEEYIYSTVKATGRSGFLDEEIYSMAVHYYDEKDIDYTRTTPPKVVVSLSAEQKSAIEAEERRRAEADFRKTCYEEQLKLLAKARQPKGRSAQAGDTQQSLF